MADEKGHGSLRHWTNFSGITRDSKKPMLPRVVYIVLGALIAFIGVLNTAFSSGSGRVLGLICLMILAPLMFLPARRRDAH